MEFLILMMKVMLGLLGVWSAVILVSIVKMMVTVRSIRGFNRRSDWWEVLGVSAVLMGTLFGIDYAQEHGMADICSLILSLGTAAIFFLFYISQRHVQNWRNVREIKRSLTKQ